MSTRTTPHTHKPIQCIDEEVTSGKVSAIVLLGSIPYQQDFSLCDLLGDINLSCPIKSGKFSIGIKLKVPYNTPSVSETVSPPPHLAHCLPLWKRFMIGG